MSSTTWPMSRRDTGGQGQHDIDDPHGHTHGAGHIAAGDHLLHQVDAAGDQEDVERDEQDRGDHIHHRDDFLIFHKGFQNLHLDVGLVLLSDAHAHPDLPDEDVTGQLLAPGEGAVEHGTHDDLNKDDQGGQHQAGTEDIFLQLVIAIDKFAEKTVFFHRDRLLSSQGNTSGRTRGTKPLARPSLKWGYDEVSGVLTCCKR